MGCVSIFGNFHCKIVFVFSKNYNKKTHNTGLLLIHCTAFFVCWNLFSLSLVYQRSQAHSDYHISTFLQHKNNILEKYSSYCFKLTKMMGNNLWEGFYKLHIRLFNKKLTYEEIFDKRKINLFSYLNCWMVRFWRGSDFQVLIDTHHPRIHILNELWS